jgi:glycerate kinase
MTHVLIAPDSFKGSLTAAEVAEALQRGLLAARPELDAVRLPIADGGEGTLDAALAAGFTRVPVTASGPTGEPVDTAYARRGRTAVVELADASGLGRLPGNDLWALAASSRGTGEVIAAAVADGCDEVVLGIGGSACTDGGAGLVMALGARLTDGSDTELPGGGAGLARLAHADFSGLRAYEHVTFVVASDVDNPLTGPHGAAAVYGPQKGATPDEVNLLDTALGRWADTVAASTGHDHRRHPGAGAAGGVGFAAVALLGATLRPGIDLLLELLDFDAHVRGAQLVITGEGSLDAQSLRGKAPMGVARAAGRAGVPVVAVCGRRDIDDEQLASAGISGAHALTDLEPDTAVCITDAARLLAEVGARIARERLPG